MPKHLLIDGDVVTYTAGFASEKTKYAVTHPAYGDIPCWFEEYDNHKEANDVLKRDVDATIWSRKEIQPIENCLQITKTLMESFFALGAESYTCVLSGKRNFREDIFPEYKANRASAPKPKHFTAIRDYLQRQYGAVITDGIEADDEIGIRAAERKYDTIVVSTDKDLKQIQGDHYDFSKKENFKVTGRDALGMFYKQLLSGDSTDNIPGLAGVGVVTAAKLIDPCTSPRDMATVVYNTYKSNLGIEQPDHIIDLHAQLLWIWRKREDRHPFFKHLGREAT